MDGMPLPSPNRLAHGAEENSKAVMLTRKIASYALCFLDPLCVKFPCCRRIICMQRHVVYCFFVCVFLRVTLSTKLTNFGSRYLVEGLSEQDEIWHDDGHWCVASLKRFWWTFACFFYRLRNFWQRISRLERARYKYLTSCSCLLTPPHPSVTHTLAHIINLTPPLLG